jgi:hypothetical protein
MGGSQKVQSHFHQVIAAENGVILSQTGFFPRQQIDLLHFVLFLRIQSL